MAHKSMLVKNVNIENSGILSDVRISEGRIRR